MAMMSPPSILSDLFDLAYKRSGEPPLEQLAREAGVHRTTLSRWRSRVRKPDADELARVLKALRWRIAIVPDDGREENSQESLDGT